MRTSTESSPSSTPNSPGYSCQFGRRSCRAGRSVDDEEENSKEVGGGSLGGNSEERRTSYSSSGKCSIGNRITRQTEEWLFNREGTPPKVSLSVSFASIVFFGMRKRYFHPEEAMDGCGTFWGDFRLRRNKRRRFKERRKKERRWLRRLPETPDNGQSVYPLHLQSMRMPIHRQLN